MSELQAALLQMPETEANGDDTTTVQLLELKTGSITLYGPEPGTQHERATPAGRQVSRRRAVPARTAFECQV